MTSRARAELIFTLKYLICFLIISPSFDDHDPAGFRGYARLTAVRDRYLIYRQVVIAPFLFARAHALHACFAPRGAYTLY